MGGAAPDPTFTSAGACNKTPASPPSPTPSSSPSRRCLLSGIGAMLAVLTNRLSRIIDRGRVLDGQLATSGPDAAASIRFELQALTRRAPARNPDRYRKPPHRPTLGRPRAAPAAA